jgi:CBS domain-containing protein/mannitol/fructose-specific phosphotransferase system IIA component (Ntr-type)
VTQLTQLLPAEHIVAPLEASTLRAALTEMVMRLAVSGAVRDRQAVEDAFDTKRDVVAIAPDVVLPHYRTDAVDRLLVGLGVAPQGLDGSDLGIYSRPRLVGLILAPRETTTLYLQAVAVLARLLRDPERVDRIASADGPAGVLQHADLDDIRLQPRLSVRDIMVHSATSVTPASPLRVAVDLMVRARMRAVPVVGEKQEVLGIVTEWDVMRALLPQIPRVGQDGGEPAVPDTMRVKDVMTRSVLCISEELGVEEAANMMINKDVEQFPVTSEGKLTGFVARGDIIRKLFGR